MTDIKDKDKDKDTNSDSDFMTEEDEERIAGALDYYGISVEDFRRAIEIITEAFDICETCKLGSKEVHSAFLSLVLGSIYHSANSIEEASEFIDMTKQFVEGSHKMGENIDEPDDIRDMVIKLLGIDPINRTIH